MSDLCHVKVDGRVEGAVRRARAAPRDRRCSRCGFAGAVDGSELPLCYECRQAARGRSAVEADHVAGRVTWGSLTVRLRANDHRAVSELRSILGFDSLPEAGDDPLLLLAHLLGGLATLLALLVDYLVAWSIELRDRYGDSYAVGLRSPVVG